MSAGDRDTREFDKFKAERLKNPEIKAAYEAARQATATTDTLAELLAEHAPSYQVDGDYGEYQWVECVCDSDYFEDTNAGIAEHRTHVADVITSSDWLREQRAEAWDEGWKEHGIDSGSCTCQFCFFGYTDDRDRLNPYRRTEK